MEPKKTLEIWATDPNPAFRKYFESGLLEV
jgi:hypothetical protein